MSVDLLKIAVFELIQDIKRFILTISSIIVASIFICLFIGASNTIHNTLMSMVNETSVETNQLIITGKNGYIMTQEDCKQLVQKTRVNDYRIIERYPIVSSVCIVDSKEIRNSNLVIYDAKSSLFTNKEKSVFKNNYHKAIRDFKEGTYITESFLKENNLAVEEIGHDSMINITIMDARQITHTLNIKIDGTIMNDELSIMNEKNKGDIFISNRCLNEYVETSSVLACTLEFDDYEKINEVQKNLESDKYSVTYDNNRLNEKKTESIIYNVIYAVIGTLILFTTISCVFITMSILLDRRREFYGMLRAIGYKKIHIIVIGIEQSLILGCLGGVIGYLLALLGRNIIGTIIVKAVLFGYDQTEPFVFSFEVGKCIIGTLVIILATLIGGSIPAIKIANKNVIRLSKEK